MADKKLKNEEEYLTSSDLDYILDVNKKAIEINIEVEKQNEQVLSILEDLKKENINDKIDDLYDLIDENKKLINELQKNSEETLRIIKEKIEKQIEKTEENTKDTLRIIKENIEGQILDIEKNMFRLMIVLGSSTIWAIIQFFFLKK